MKLTTTLDKSLNSISALLHGDSGIGKTTSALTLPPDKTVIVTGERSTLPLRNVEFPVFRFETWEDIQGIYRAFVSPDKIKDPKAAKAVKGCRIIFLDSLSEVHNKLVHNIYHSDMKRVNLERSGGKIEMQPGTMEEQLSMEAWGLYRTRILKLIGAFTHLPVNVICTALSAWSKDKQGGDVYRTPNLSGKAALECPAQFDLVLHMEANDEGERVWRTFNDGEILAKDASGVLDPFEPSNWTKLFGKILKGNKKDA